MKKPKEEEEEEERDYHWLGDWTDFDKELGRISAHHQRQTRVFTGGSCGYRAKKIGLAEDRWND